MRLTQYKEYYLNLFRIDSIEGNPELALAHYIRYTELNDSLNNADFKERLANQAIYLQLESKEYEIERLTLDNQFKDFKIRQKRITNYGYVTFSLLMLTIVFLVIRSYRKIKENNIMLEKQKEDLKAAQQRLVQSEKMASIGTLTAGIAHEINNPLNFISGGLNIVKELQEGIDWEGREDEQQRCLHATKMAFDGLDRTVGIVKALMTFSHRGGSKKVETDLNETIDNTLMFLNSKISNDIQIIKKYKLEKHIPVFPEKIHQVIMNILDNAIFAVNMESSPPRIITISTEITGDGIILSFSNTGPSIAEEHLDQLFDPFFTTKDPGQGTGLGLLYLGQCMEFQKSWLLLLLTQRFQSIGLAWKDLKEVMLFYRNFEAYSFWSELKYFQGFLSPKNIAEFHLLMHLKLDRSVLFQSPKVYYIFP